MHQRNFNVMRLLCNYSKVVRRFVLHPSASKNSVKSRFPGE